MEFILGIGIAAWVLCPFALIPIVLVLNNKVKKKDDEIRRLYGRLSDLESDRKARSTREAVSQQIQAVQTGTESPAHTNSENEHNSIFDEMMDRQPAPERAQTEQAADVRISDTHVQQRVPLRREAVRPRPVQSRPVQQRPVKQKKPVETGHILFGAGVLLVFIAGLIFATSMWSIMPSAIKVTTLFVAALFFIGVAWLLEVRLKLREASVTMFILGSIFMSLTVIAVGYFAWLGNAFSLGTRSRYLVISVSLYMLTASLFLGYRLYGNVVFRIISYISSCIAFTFLAKYICTRGNVTLAVTGVYMLAIYIITGYGRLAAKHAEGSEITKHRSIMYNVSDICAMAYMAISLLMFFAFGNDRVMSLTFLADILLGCAVAYINEESTDETAKRSRYFWLYYAVPVFGAFFAYNFGLIFRTVIPHGDVMTGMLMSSALLLMYRYLKLHGENRLMNYSAYAVTLISQTVYMAMYDRFAHLAHDSFADVTEALPVMIAFLAVIIVYSWEYLHALKSYGSGDGGINGRIYLITLSICVFAALYVPAGTALYLDTRYAAYLRTLIPLALFAVAVTGITLLYHYRLSIVKLGRDIVFTEAVAGAFLNASTVISFIVFIDAPHTTCVTFFPVIAACVLYQASARLKKSNPFGVITAFILPFAIIGSIDSIAEDVLPGNIAVSENMQYELGMFILLCVLIIGLFSYRRLLEIDRGRKRILIDWNAVIAFILLLCLIPGGAPEGIKHMDVRYLVAVAVFALYFSRRFENVGRRISYSAAAGILCIAYVVQDYVPWKADLKYELSSLALLFFAAAYRFIWAEPSDGDVSENVTPDITAAAFSRFLKGRGYKGHSGWVCYGLISVFLFIQWLAITEVEADPAMPVVNAKLWFFLLYVLAACVFAFIRNRLRYDILATALIVLFTVSSISSWRVVQLVIAFFVSAGAVAYFYIRKRQPLSLAPLLMMLAMIYNALIPHLMDRLDESFTIKGGILVPGMRPTTVICLIWMLVFAAMQVLGRLLHSQVFSRNEVPGVRIDWFGITSLLPIIVILDVGNNKMKWAALIMVALYLFGYYRRVSPILNKPLLTLISLCIAVAWWTQPLFKIKELYATEWRIVGFLALCYVVFKRIYRDELSDAQIDLMYWSCVASVIWQSASAIHSAELFDVIILGLVLLVMLVVSFERRSRRWFLLSSITLVCILLYMSRSFWRRIIWPVYVFAIGIILIFLATRNEYRKKHGITKEDRKKFFEGWNR